MTGVTHRDGWSGALFLPGQETQSFPIEFGERIWAPRESDRLGSSDEWRSFSPLSGGQSPERLGPHFFLQSSSSEEEEGLSGVATMARVSKEVDSVASRSFGRESESVSPIQVRVARSPTSPVMPLAILTVDEEEGGRYKATGVYTEEAFDEIPQGKSVRLYRDSFNKRFLRGFQEGASKDERVIACARALVEQGASISAVKCKSSKRSPKGKKYNKLRFSNVCGFETAKDLEVHHYYGVLTSWNREYGVARMLCDSKNKEDLPADDLDRVIQTQIDLGNLKLTEDYDRVDVRVQAADKERMHLQWRDVVVKFSDEYPVDGFSRATLVNKKQCTEDYFEVFGRFIPARGELFKGQLRIEKISYGEFSQQKESFLISGKGQVVCQVPLRYLSGIVGETSCFKTTERALSAFLKYGGEFNVIKNEQLLTTENGFIMADIGQKRFAVEKFLDPRNAFSALFEDE